MFTVTNNKWKYTRFHLTKSCICTVRFLLFVLPIDVWYSLLPFFISTLNRIYQAIFHISYFRHSTAPRWNLEACILFYICCSTIDAVVFCSAVFERKTRSGNILKSIVFHGLNIKPWNKSISDLDCDRIQNVKEATNIRLTYYSLYVVQYYVNAAYSKN